MKKDIAQYTPNYYYSKVVDIVDHEAAKHHHQAFEIYYMKDGICNYSIGNHSYKVKSGDVILIPGGTKHRTKYGGVAHTRMLINCGYEYIPSAVIERLPYLNYLYRNSKVMERLEEIFAKIEEEYAHPDSLSEEVLKCYTSELFFLIMRNENEHAHKKNEDGLVEEVLKYIQHNYMNEVKLSAVAKQVSVSAEHLSREFKKQTGLGFKEYLTTLRLQKAEDMLKNEPGRAVCEVAYACGFNDGNYFSYKFKQAYGVPPSMVRPR